MQVKGNGNGSQPAFLLELVAVLRREAMRGERVPYCALNSLYLLLSPSWTGLVGAVQSSVPMAV